TLGIVFVHALSHLTQQRPNLAQGPEYLIFQRMAVPNVDRISAPSDLITERRGSVLSQTTEYRRHHGLEVIEHGSLPPHWSPQRDQERARSVADVVFALDALDPPGGSQPRDARFNRRRLQLDHGRDLFGGERSLAVDERHQQFVLPLGAACAL